MKNLYLFSTKLWLFVAEIPPIILLLVSIRYNAGVENIFKLYPLIVLCALAIIFILLFFFRGIILSEDGIKSYGVFGDKDSAIIRDNSRLTLTLRSNGIIKVELFGIADSENPTYHWLKDEEAREVNIYRHNAIGGKRTVGRILKFYGVDPSALSDIHKSDEYTKEYPLISLEVKRTEDIKVFSIRFKEFERQKKSA